MERKMENKELKQDINYYYSGLNDFLNGFFTKDLLKKSQKYILTQLTDILDENAVSIEMFRLITTEYIASLLRKASLIYYLYMREKQDWTYHGEQTVSVSLCRSIEEIDNDVSVSQIDADNLLKKAESMEQELGGYQSAEYYKNLYQNFTINLFGKNYNWWNINELNTFFKKNRMSVTVKYTESDNFFDFIFFEIEKSFSRKKIDSIRVIMAGKEYARSPVKILALCSPRMDSSLVIRRTSLEVIFHNKWKNYFLKSKIDIQKSLEHPNSGISHGLQRKCMESYKIGSLSDLVDKKDKFIDDMITGIICFQNGNENKQKQIVTKYRLLSAAMHDEEEITNIISVVINDWISSKEYSSSIDWFLGTLKKNSNELGPVFQYLSDTWFLDEENKNYMLDRSEIAHALFLKYMTGSSKVDIDLLVSEKFLVSTMLIEEFEKSAEKYLEIFENSSFRIMGIEKTWKQYKNEKYEELKTSGLLNNESELYNKWDFWEAAYKYLKDFSPKAYALLCREKEECRIDIRKKIFSFVIKNESVIYTSLRHYIYEKYKQLGVLRITEEFDYNSLITKIFSEVDFTLNDQNRILEKTKSIFAGREYNISVLSRDEYDPFITFIQYIMLQTNMGEILSPLKINAISGASISRKQEMQILNSKLFELKSKIEHKIVDSYVKIVVNRKYNILNFVEMFIENEVFSDGTKFSSYVITIEEKKISDDIFIKAHCSLSKGKMDWLTSCAVSRINNHLRPNEYLEEWTIDSYFMEAVLTKYQKLDIIN